MLRLSYLAWVFALISSISVMFHAYQPSSRPINQLERLPQVAVPQ
jgi:hypothetical protein